MSDPRAPSGWQIERSLARWHELRERLRTDDPLLIADEQVIAGTLAENGEADPHTLLSRLIDADVWCERRAEEADQIRRDAILRRDRYLDRQKNIRATILDLMDVLDLKRHRATMGLATLMPTKAAVVFTDEQAIPDAYCTISREPSRTLMRPALEAGEVVPGAVLSNPGVTVQIRKL